MDPRQTATFERPNPRHPIQASKRRESLTAEGIDSILSLHLPRDASDPNLEEFLAKACLAFEAGMTKRSIAITKRGYIGAIPQEAQLGDLVCVLFGCSVPVVLRKRIGEEYQFVGECYIHGLMDGEALAMQATGQVEAHDFVLITFMALVERPCVGGRS